MTGAGAAETLSHCELGARGGSLAGEGQEVTQGFTGSLWAPQEQTRAGAGRPMGRLLHWPR